MVETLQQFVAGAMGGLALLIGKLFVDRFTESHKADVSIAAKRRERFQDKQAQVAAELYEKLANCTSAVFMLVVVEEPDSRISHLLESESRAKRLKDLLPAAEQAWGELSTYYNAHSLYFSDSLLTSIRRAGHHMEKVIDDVHKLIELGTDQVKQEDKIIIDKARL
jgi:hypothetical protein